MARRITRRRVEDECEGMLDRAAYFATVGNYEMAEEYYRPAWTIAVHVLDMFEWPTPLEWVRYCREAVQ